MLSPVGAFGRFSASDTGGGLGEHAGVVAARVWRAGRLQAPGHGEAGGFRREAVCAEAARPTLARAPWAGARGEFGERG